MALARLVGVSLSEARALLQAAPVLLPRALDTVQIAELTALGASLETLSAVHPDARCARHPLLFADESCRQCRARMCTACQATGKGRCGTCRERARRKRLFFRIRVAFLLAIFAGVLLWAFADVRRRRARNDWQRPVSVAIVVVRLGAVQDTAVQKLRQRTPALEDRLAAESLRLHARAGAHPFELTAFGPVDVTSSPPSSSSDSLWSLAKHTLAKRRYFSDVDERAGLDASAYDSRIYLVARPPAHAGRKSVEGEREEGGRIGFVEVELADDMADFALFVAAHELLHTLGATDKYDAAGRARVPEGLADPERAPRFPQLAAEVMARNVPLSATQERPPESLDELAVGPTTAQEIGWLPLPE